MIPTLPMLGSLAKIIGAKIGMKPVKYFVDNFFREKVIPIPGSVVYCDLAMFAEHSGIYLEQGVISNIEVTGLMDSEVTEVIAEEFTYKSVAGSKIYVSCDSNGPVGHKTPAVVARNHVGQQSFYGLVFKNCHEFSSKCVRAKGTDVELDLFKQLGEMLVPDAAWEPTFKQLKRDARAKLGATKWRLWDWQNNEEEEVEEPDWKAQNNFFRQQALTPEFVELLRNQQETMDEYLEEIADENLPSNIVGKLQGFKSTLDSVAEKYQEVKDFLLANPDSAYSFDDLNEIKEDYSQLAKLLLDNRAIQELAHKMGRNYISEEKKKQGRLFVPAHSEVHGTRLSSDVMRMLPSELANLDDETLEVLFYARLLENNLMTYQLVGTQPLVGEVVERQNKRTGPVVACLDTSASMSGKPQLLAKALLLKIAGILKSEERSLHVVLFGGSDQTKEFVMHCANDSVGLLRFLQKGYGGGTCFETPLRKAIHIIESEPDFIKADILMISDGDCSLSDEFALGLKQQATVLDFSVYSVLCNGARVEDNFSDEVVVL